jgi:hypothetical protein
MGLTKKRRKSGPSDTSGNAASNASIDGLTSYGSVSPLSQLASRLFAKDALLEAAESGWETTFRYAFLLVIKRITMVGEIWITAELAHHLRWF